MCKAVKRLSSMIWMIMIMMLLSITALADENGNERMAVYVQVPDDWENPCVWAWNEEGNNAFDAWPGSEMEKDLSNEEWYYLWIPNWADHVIINANDGTVQTGELILEGNAWLRISSPDSVEISYDQLTEGEIPEYVEKFIVHAKVEDSWENPCLWAWSAPDGTNAFEAWPGMEMTKGENGWYSTKAPIWVNSIIINANEGGVQTEDISIDPAEVWVTVQEDGSYDYSYVDPDKEEVADISVRVIAPADWEAPCLWAWSAPDGTNVFATWPGEALEEDENGWLIKEVPGWVNSIIVNGNEGSVQTADVSVEAGKDVWLVVNGAEDYEVFYEEPEVNAAQPTDENAETEEESHEIEEPAAEEMTQVSSERTGGNYVLVVIGIIAVVVIAVLIFIVMKKKKK